MGTINELRMLQALPLDIKIKKTELRIKEFINTYGADSVYVAFSGGKDSTVLINIVRNICPDIPGVFSNTGVEFPEVLDFVKQYKKDFGNIIIIRPEMSFKGVLERYGYPVVSKTQSQYIHELRTTKSDKLKLLRLNGRGSSNMGAVSKKWLYLKDAPFKIHHKCCDIIKKNPSKKYEATTGRHPIIGTMAVESDQRQLSWVNHGCNNYDTDRPTCKPLSFWTDTDIWEYIRRYNVAVSKIYEMGYHQTGCMYCLYGLNFDTQDRFEKMKISHPKQYDFCMNRLNYKKVLPWLYMADKDMPATGQMTIDDYLS